MSFLELTTTLGVARQTTMPLITIVKNSTIGKKTWGELVTTYYAKPQ
jgi:hypothetical protein